MGWWPGKVGRWSSSDNDDGGKDSGMDISIPALGWTSSTDDDDGGKEDGGISIRWPSTADEEKNRSKLSSLRDYISNRIPGDVKDTLREYISIPDDMQDALDKSMAMHVVGTNEGQAVLAVGCLASFALGFKAGRLQPAWRRFTQVSEISNIGPASPWLRGRVLSVSDGDTIRFLHAPVPIFSPSSLKEGEKKSDTALPIRICTIDTPEVAKFGKPGQPYGVEAKEHLSSMISDEIVKVRLLHKDQYGRGVAQVSRPRFGFWNQDMDEAMLNAGLAEVYRGGGAVYGPKGLDAYVAMEESAKKSGEGMWADEDRESAAEFKARMKADG